MKRIMAVFVFLMVTALLVFAAGGSQPQSRVGTGGVEWVQGTTTNVSSRALPVRPQAGEPIEFPQSATSYTTNTRYPNQPTVSNVNGFPIVQQQVTMRVATPTSTLVNDYVNNDAVIFMEREL